MTDWDRGRPLVHPEKTRANYALFLDTPFWRCLTARKKALVGKCEMCGSREDLQSHHHRYPDSWWDTTEDDLTVLCRACHEREHGIAVGPESAGTPEIRTMKELLAARSSGLIDRKTFVELRAGMIMRGRLMPTRKASRKRINGRRGRLKKSTSRQKMEWATVKALFSGQIKLPTRPAPPPHHIQLQPPPAPPGIRNELHLAANDKMPLPAIIR